MLGTLLLRKFQKKATAVKSIRTTLKRKPVVKAAPDVRPEPTNPTLPAVNLVRPSDHLKKSIESFLLDQRSEHTRRAYGKDLKRFISFLLTRTRPDFFDRSTIIAYKDSLLSQNLQHTTIDRHLATLRSFFRWLCDDGHLEKNPAENVRFLNPKRESKTEGFTDEEVLQVLKVPNLHTRTGSMQYAILMMLFFCGMRRSELCSLTTKNLGFERGHRFIRLRGKGNAERIVVLTDPVWNAITHYLKMARKNIEIDQALFSPVRNNRTGKIQKPLDPSMIFYLVTRAAKRAGITKRVSPHSCRATAISNARDHQVPDRAIQEFAGWSTTTMITRYDKRKSTLEKSAVHAIDYGSDMPNLPEV